MKRTNYETSLTEVFEVMATASSGKIKVSEHKNKVIVLCELSKKQFEQLEKN